MSRKLGGSDTQRLSVQLTLWKNISGQQRQWTNTGIGKLWGKTHSALGLLLMKMRSKQFVFRPATRARDITSYRMRCSDSTLWYSLRNYSQLQCAVADEIRHPREWPGALLVEVNKTENAVGGRIRMQGVPLVFAHIQARTLTGWSTRKSLGGSRRAPRTRCPAVSQVAIQRFLRSRSSSSSGMPRENACHAECFSWKRAQRSTAWSERLRWGIMESWGSSQVYSNVIGPLMRTERSGQNS